MKLEDLQAAWQIDATIDQSKLDSEALRVANLHQKYLDLLTLYRIKVFKSDNKYLEMKGSRTRYFMGQMTQSELEKYGWQQYQYKNPLKAELERLLETDTIMIDLSGAVFYNTTCFQYCEEVLKSLRNRGYDIKNSIEFMKFTSGG